MSLQLALEHLFPGILEKDGNIFSCLVHVHPLYPVFPEAGFAYSVVTLLVLGHQDLWMVPEAEHATDPLKYCVSPIINSFEPKVAPAVVFGNANWLDTIFIYREHMPITLKKINLAAVTVLHGKRALKRERILRHT